MTLNAVEVLRAYRELQEHVLRVERQGEALVGQNRELLQRLQVMEGERAAWDAERLLHAKTRRALCDTVLRLLRAKEELLQAVGRAALIRDRQSIDDTSEQLGEALAQIDELH